MSKYLGPMRRTAVNLLLAMAALVVALSLAEGVLHIVSGPTVPPTGTQFYQYNPQVGWSKIPGKEGWFVCPEYTVYKKINSKGLRGPECPYEKPENEYRILCLGDSFSEGYAVELKDLFTNLLQDALNGRNDGRKYRVINGGTAAYSTDQELLFYETEGHKYHPDLVVLLFCLNDVWFNTRDQYPPKPKPLFKLEDEKLVLTNSPVPRADVFPEETGPQMPRQQLSVASVKEWLNEHSRIYSFVRSRIKGSSWLNRAAVWLGLSHGLGKSSGPAASGLLVLDESAPAAPLPDVYKVWYKSPPSEIQYAWQVTELILARLRRSVEANGGRLLVFYIPDKGSVEEDGIEGTKRNYGLTDELFDLDEPGKRVKSICEKLSIPCMKPTDVFRSEARRLAAKGQCLHFRFDMHWNANGNALAAKLLLQRIEAEFLPQGKNAL
ncbi:MAG TPA: SGNH/GDSL hydrolase family protein [bacterium]|nr:SGNH/GDSL hydrolase family protein [bacterium]